MVSSLFTSLGFLRAPVGGAVGFEGFSGVIEGKSPAMIFSNILNMMLFSTTSTE